MRNPETCLCSAVVAEDGTVVQGRRHGDCLAEIVRRGLKRKYGSSNETQGFITSTGRYVTRTEAYRLQKAAGLPSAAPDGYRDGLGELFSEDLY